MTSYNYTTGMKCQNYNSSLLPALQKRRTAHASLLPWGERKPKYKREAWSAVLGLWAVLPRAVGVSLPETYAPLKLEPTVSGAPALAG